MFDHPAFATLNRMDRTEFRVVRFFNQGGGQRVGLFWQRAVVTPLVGLLFRGRLEIHGLHRLAAVPDGAPILLVANHRTFFDLFTLGWILITHPRLTRRVSFPVRSNFFYETPLGLLMCVLGTGCSMFPPFFRSAEKKAMNRVSLEILLEKLRTPGQLVGFHPEGTRNKTADPYTLLPAQPGAGELALKARPVVVPAFILGMTNSFGTDLKASLRRRSKVIAVFGDPVPLPDDAGVTRLSHHKRFADAINQRIAALGAEERAIRSALPASRAPGAK